MWSYLSRAIPPRGSLRLWPPASPKAVRAQAAPPRAALLRRSLPIRQLPRLGHQEQTRVGSEPAARRYLHKPVAVVEAAATVPRDAAGSASASGVGFGNGFSAPRRAHWSAIPACRCLLPERPGAAPRMRRWPLHRHSGAQASPPPGASPDAPVVEPLVVPLAAVLVLRYLRRLLSF